MKKIGAIILLMFFALLAFSQSDDKSIEILDKLSTKLENYNGLHLEFNLIVDNTQEGVLDTIPGDILYSNGKYRFEMLDQLVFSDGGTSWTYLKEVEEINITEATGGEEVNYLNPKLFLRNYKEDYKCRFISDKFVKNRPLVEIDLYPVSVDDKDFSRITLFVDKAKLQIYSVVYIAKNGVNYKIDFLRFIENPNIDIKDITFNENDYPDAEIIDMR